MNPLKGIQGLKFEPIAPRHMYMKLGSREWEDADWGGELNMTKVSSYEIHKDLYVKLNSHKDLYVKLNSNVLYKVHL